MKNSKIEQILDEETEFIFPIQGKSMLPLFRQKKDCVIISKENLSDIKKYDIVLYKVPSNYILHRVLKIKDDTLIIRGDNTFNLEYVPLKNIEGKVKAFYRNNKYINIYTPSLKTYIIFWNLVFPLRYIFHCFKRIIKKLFIWKKK